MAVHMMPVRGQDFSSQKKVLEAFRGDEVFELADNEGPWAGQKIGRPQVETLHETVVHIKYSNLSRVTTLVKDPETGKWEID